MLYEPPIIDPAYPINWESPLNVGLRYWWLAGTSGRISDGTTARDLTGRFHGDLLGTPPVYGLGLNGFGDLTFNGSSDYVAVLANPSTATTHWGISAWVYPASISQNSICVYNGIDANGWGFGMNNGAGTAVGSKLTALYGGVIWRDSGYTFPSASRWYHVIATRDATTLRFFVNGVQTANTFTNNPIAPASSRFSIGCQYNTTSTQFRFWNGAIQDVLVHNRYLGNTPANLYEQGLKGYRTPNSPLNFLRSWSFGIPVVTGIAFDAATNSGYNAASNSFSWSHTCTGTDRYLAVDIGRLSVPGTTVTALTYAGVSLTQIGATSSGTDAGRIEMWGLANPASGSNTISVTLSAICINSGCAVSYTGVHQTVPTEAYNGATATNVGAADATVTITTVADNDWVHGALATDDGDVTANQTTRNEVNGAGGSVANENTGPKTPAGTQVVSYTDVGAAATWTIGGYGIRPVAASGLANTTGLFLASLGVG